MDQGSNRTIVNTGHFTIPASLDKNAKHQLATGPGGSDLLALDDVEGLYYKMSIRHDVLRSNMTDRGQSTVDNLGST